MMSIEDDNNFCANCVMHNWEQPEDKSSLKPCRKTKSMPDAGCGKILYCGKACRNEHWEKVHKNHCQYLADPSKCPESQHDAESCAICRPAAGTGKGKRRMAGRDKKRNLGSSSYECITKDMHFAPSLASPHPFPVAGVGDDLLEKSIIVIQNLVHKLKQNPRVAMTCSAELEKMERFLWSMRQIWRHRKLFSHPQNVVYGNKIILFLDLVKSVKAKVSQGNAGKDAWELWKIIYFAYYIAAGIVTYRQQQSLKNPIESMPEQFRDLVKLGLDNKVKFIDIAEDIMDSLSTQVIPYEDIVKQLCGGKKRPNCSFCGVKIEVTEYICIKNDKKSSSVLFSPLSIRIFTCGSQDCHTKAVSRDNDMCKFSVAVVTACNERGGTCCDFCFQLCPIENEHRCCNCLTVMHCSNTCNKADKEHRKIYCIEDERKTKEDSSMRRQMGEITPERMAAMAAGSGLKNRKAVLNEALEAFQFEDKSKKRAGDNPNTSIPAAATVPTAQDDRKKSGTEAANTENASEAGAAADTEHRSTSGAGAAGGPKISGVD